MRATTRATPRSNAGFTLIEAVLATSLLAMGVALAFGILRGATGATARAESAAQRQERLRAVQGFLRTQVNAALPIGFEFDGDTGEATFFRVAPRKLELVASMPGYLSRGGPYLQTFALVDGPGGQRLVFQDRMLAPDGPLEPERPPLVLLDGIADASFESQTFGADGQLAGWGAWTQSAQLPPLVRLRLRFVDDRRWPGFVAGTRLGVATLPAAPQAAPPVGAR
jgi:general secretion pathway protein J